MRTKDISDLVFQEQLMQLTRLFGYFSAKDTFLFEMRKRLSPRLLYGDVYVENEKLLMRLIIK